MEQLPLADLEMCSNKFHNLLICVLLFALLLSYILDLRCILKSCSNQPVKINIYMIFKSNNYKEIDNIVHQVQQGVVGLHISPIKEQL